MFSLLKRIDCVDDDEGDDERVLAVRECFRNEAMCLGHRLVDPHIADPNRRNIAVEEKHVDEINDLSSLPPPHHWATEQSLHQRWVRGERV